MPATLTTLRVGEVLRATARVLDNLGSPIEIENPAFNDFNGDVVDLVPVDGNPYSVLVSGEAPGTDTLTFSGRDAFDASVEESTTIRVLDASRLELRVSAPVNCKLAQTNGRVLVYLDVDPAGDPSFTLTVVALDERGGPTRRGEVPPTYAFGDGPNVVSTHGRILLNGNGAGIPSEDDATVNCLCTARGEEVFDATAVTAATGQTITGQLKLTVVTAASATITAEPEA